MNIANIYSLSDPRDGVCRYIGYTTLSVEKRRAKHIYNSWRGDAYRDNWIKSLLKVGLEPIVDLIDIVPFAEWDFWEQHYVSLYKSWGFPLTNLTRGGKTMYFNSNSTEIIEKARKTRNKNKKPRTKEQLARHKAAAAKKNWKAIMHDGVRKKMSISAKNRTDRKPHTQESKTKISLAKMGWKPSEETIKNMSLARMGCEAWNKIPIVGINIKDKSDILFYESIHHATLDGFDGSTIHGCIHKKLKKNKNFIWLTKEEFKSLNEIELNNLLNQKWHSAHISVCKVDLNNNIVATYQSKREAAKANGLKDFLIKTSISLGIIRDGFKYVAI